MEFSDPFKAAMALLKQEPLPDDAADQLLAFLSFPRSAWECILR